MTCTRRYNFRIYLFAAEFDKKSIGDELYILLHQITIHANEVARQSIGEEVLLNTDRIHDNLVDTRLGWFVD